MKQYNKFYIEILYSLLFAVIYYVLGEINVTYMLSETTSQTLNVFQFSFAPYMFASLLYMLMQLTIPYFKELKEEGYIGSKKSDIYVAILSCLILNIMFFFNLYTDIAIYIKPQYRTIPSMFLIYTVVCIPSCILYFYVKKITKYTLISSISIFIVTDYVKKGSFAFLREFSNITSFEVLNESYFIIFAIMAVYMLAYINTKEMRLYTKYPSKITRYKIYAKKDLFISFKYNSSIMFATVLAESFASTALKRFTMLTIAEYDFIFLLLIFIACLMFSTLTILNHNSYDNLLQNNGRFIYNEKRFKSNKQFYYYKIATYVFGTSLYLTIIYTLFYFISMMAFGYFDKYIVIIAIISTTTISESIFNATKHYLIAQNFKTVNEVDND